MYKGHSSTMIRLTGLFLLLLAFLPASGQGRGDASVRAQADALFAEERFAEAMPLYAQLVSLSPSDHDLNYRLGTCIVHSGGDKEQAIGFLRYAVQNASVPPLAWYYYGRAFHLTYQFAAALDAYQHFRGLGDKKALATHPVEALEKQCRNGLNLLNNLKEVSVHNKVEVPETEFFRYYDLTGIGGRIVVTPDELMSSLDKKSKERSLIYLPEKGGRIYFSSYGKDGRTGRDIYTTSLMPDGTFDEPLKLAGYVNTEQDESFAFLAPDGKTFYFCSKGHNSMGGYDVFKSSYDGGLDVYGPPVNLDFAVNTPNDDIFYMVDAEGKEACFASGRDSDQGMIHVYRVSTAQQPITITVLKGTFASELDAKDRDAHIVVEDATTHEQVADVRTDMNGSYVLSLPRNGRYKFSVEAGPAKRTHVGVVEVPRSDAPRAYRQELTLVDQGGEKLMIRNYFDEPLPDDLIALALDEIKRRAKLDVGQVSPVAQAEQPQAPPTDVITAAGFTGDMTKERVLQAAHLDVQELTAKAEELDGLSGAAFGRSIEALAEAQRATREAQDHIAQADATSDANAKNGFMAEAAEARKRSRDAVLRARAAYRAGQDLDVQQDSVQRKGIIAQRVDQDLTAALQRGDDQAALPLLRQLKQRSDERSRPSSGLSPDELARRKASALEQEARKAMDMANAKRADEEQLTDQVNRLKRERDAAKGGKREQLERQVNEQEGYRTALHEEVEKAFAHARALENETAVARAQTSLTRHLATTKARTNITELDAAQLASLEQRIAETDGSIAALPIDERFDAMLPFDARPTPDREDYDWDLASVPTSERAATTVVARDSSAIAALAESRRTDVNAAPGSGQVQNAQAPEVGISHDAPAFDARMADANGGQDTRPDAVAGAESTSTAVLPASPADRSTTGTQAQEVPPRDQPVAQGDPGRPPLTPEQVRSENGAIEEVAQATAGTTFLKENELAETRQLRQAERTRSRRDSLDARIATLEQELAAARTGGTEIMAGDRDANDTSVDATDSIGVSAASEGTVGALRFDANAPEAEVIDGIFARFEADRRSIAALEDAEERAASLNGLELMLVDSINAQTNAQLAELEKTPSRSTEILPRVDRLRMMRGAHQRAAEEALAIAVPQQPPLRATDVPLLVSAQGAIPVPEGPDASGMAGRYVEVDADPEYVYESRLEHRSPNVLEASAAMNRDVVAILDLEDRIDSLEDVLEGMPQGKAYDKLRDRTDRLIDDRMILRTEMGQRTEYISKEEWKAGQDSLARVQRGVEQRGLAPNEPLLVMAGRMEADAHAHFDAAQTLRKRADRSEDIVMRDSLFRTAYREELIALHALDQAITVNGFIASAHFHAGDRPTYAELESLLLGVHEAGAVAQRQAGDEDGSGNSASEVAPATLPSDSVHAGRVKEMFGGALASDAVSAAPLDLKGEPAQLAQLALRADVSASELEQRSIETGDRAIALRDSAATAKKRDRSVMEQEALRMQQLSDSLHAASLAQADSARAYEQRARDAQQAQAFRAGLNKFYYLSNEEQGLVVNDQDHSRYFQVKVRSLEQEQEAAAARSEAASARELSNAIAAESRALLKPDATGNVPDAARARSEELAVRSGSLAARADSLDNVASRLSGASVLNAGQAASLLEGMPAARSSAIMALEQSARRSEPFLAEAHSLAGEGTIDFESMIKAAERAERTGATLAQARTDVPANPTSGEPDQVPAQAPTGNGVAPAQGVGVKNGSEPAAQADTRANLEQPVVTPEGSTVRVTVPVTDAPVEPPVSAVPVELAPAFVAPEVLTADVFYMRAPGERVAVEIPIDRPKPAGLVFSVQIGAFRNPIPADLFGDMSPVMGESVGNGLTRYTAGLFTAYTSANGARDQVHDRGYKDAFVVAYRDGRRITLAEAMRGIAPVPAPTIAQQPVQVPTGQDTAQVAAAPAPVLIQAPSQVGVVVPEEQAVLANYPASAEAIVAQFQPPADATAYYNDPNAAPARQVESVKGLFFTVQVGVYSKPVPLDKLFNITPLNSERTETGKIRYTTGVYLDMERVRARKDRSVALGVKDAFVTAYLNGRRIPMRDARALLARYGTGILADPAIATP